MKRRILAMLIALTMILGSFMLSACGGADEPAVPDEPVQEEVDDEDDEEDEPLIPEEMPEAAEDAGGGVLRFASQGVDGRFTPITSSNVYDAHIVALVFDSLFMTNAEGIPEPLLATWETSEDHLVYTFTIDERAHFSDGVPVTAADVYFTFDSIRHEDYDGPRSYAVANLADMEILDERVIAFTFEEASPLNIWNLGYEIMPEHIYAFDAWDDFLDMELSPVGSGRFLFVDYRPMEHVHLVANTDHWHPDRVPQVDEFFMIDIPEELLADALTAGQVDFVMPSATIDNYELFSGLPGSTLEVVTVLGYQYMQFNTLRPTLEDVRVRQALMYALDRRAWIDIIHGPLGTIGTAPFANASWAFPHDLELNTYEFDLDRANELMEEAGWVMGDDGVRVNADGVRMELVWPVYTEVPWPGALAEMAYDTWGQIGVDLTIDLMDFVSVQALTGEPPPGEKDFCVYVMGFSLGIDPGNMPLFDYDDFGAGGFNASGFYHPEIQRLIAEGRSTFDIEERQAIYAELAQLTNYYVATVILAYRGELWTVGDHVQGFFVNTFNRWTANAHNITVN